MLTGSNCCIPTSVALHSQRCSKNLKKKTEKKKTKQHSSGLRRRGCYINPDVFCSKGYIEQQGAIFLIADQIR